MDEEVCRLKARGSAVFAHCGELTDLLHRERDLATENAELRQTIARITDEARFVTSPVIKRPITTRQSLYPEAHLGDNQVDENRYYESSKSAHSPDRGQTVGYSCNAREFTSGRLEDYKRLAGSSMHGNTVMQIHGVAVMQLQQELEQTMAKLSFQEMTSSQLAQELRGCQDQCRKMKMEGIALRHDMDTQIIELQQEVRRVCLKRAPPPLPHALLHFTSTHRWIRYGSSSNREMAQKHGVNIWKRRWTARRGTQPIYYIGQEHVSCS
jgi:hypothetical protein